MQIMATFDILLVAILLGSDQRKILCLRGLTIKLNSNSVSKVANSLFKKTDLQFH